MFDRVMATLDRLATQIAALWLRSWQRRTDEGAYSGPYWC